MKNLQELETEELTKVEGGSWYPWNWASLILDAHGPSWSVEDHIREVENTIV